MGQQNVDVVHAFTEAFNATEIEALIACREDALRDLSVFEDAREPIAP